MIRTFDEVPAGKDLLSVRWFSSLRRITDLHFVEHSTLLNPFQTSSALTKFHCQYPNLVNFIVFRINLLNTATLRTNAVVPAEGLLLLTPSNSPSFRRRLLEIFVIYEIAILSALIGLLIVACVYDSCFDSSYRSENKAEAS